jgi:hypothetical protein
VPTPILAGLLAAFYTLFLCLQEKKKKKNGMQRREEDSWPCMHESNNRFCNVNFSEFVLSNRRRSTN